MGHDWASRALSGSTPAPARGEKIQWRRDLAQKQVNGIHIALRSGLHEPDGTGGDPGNHPR